MIITQKFPYPHCDSCPEFVLDVENSVIYEVHGILTRQMIVSCKNESLCRRLEVVRDAKGNCTDTDNR